jgi:hypothetical protein
MVEDRDFIKEKFSKNLKEGLEPVNFSFFSSSGKYENFNCLYSQGTMYQFGEKYSLYQIPSLIRVLLDQGGHIDGLLSRQLYDRSPGLELCYILRWEKEEKEIVIFDLKDNEHFNEVRFSEKIESMQDEILQMIKNLKVSMNFIK